MRFRAMLQQSEVFGNADKQTFSGGLGVYPGEISLTLIAFIGGSRKEIPFQYPQPLTGVGTSLPSKLRKVQAFALICDQGSELGNIVTLRCIYAWDTHMLLTAVYTISS